MSSKLSVAEVLANLESRAAFHREREAVPEIVMASPEHRLCEKLAETDPDSAHSRYNALVRRLVSFENTAECVGVSPAKNSRT
jgi:hypothetical protein